MKKAQFQNTTLSSELEVGNETYHAGKSVEEEFYKYYTVKVVSASDGGKGYWVDFDKLKPGAVQTKQELVSSHRKASVSEARSRESGTSIYFVTFLINLCSTSACRSSSRFTVCRGGQ